MITLSAAYLEATRKANVEPIVHVAMQTYDGTRSLYFHNGHGGVEESISGDPILKSVTTVSAEIDAVTRDSQISSIQFEVLDDGYIRSLASSHELFNAHVYVQIGVADITLSDFHPIFFGKISRMWSTEGALFFEATDYVDFTMNPPDRLRTYVNEHPLTVLHQALQDAGIPASRLDASTFASTYLPGFSHYCFSSYTGNVWGDAEVKVTNPRHMSGYDAVYIEGRHSYNAPGTGAFEDGEGTGHFINMTVVRPKLFLKEFCELTRSALRKDVTSEKLKIVHTDKLTATSHHFTVDEYSDFEIIPNPVIFNQVVISFGFGPNEFELTIKDTDSITNFGTLEYKTRVNYLTAGSAVYQSPPEYEDYTGFVDGDSAAFDNLYLRDAGITGFCGTRNLQEDTQIGDDKVDAGNLFFGLYLKGVYKSSGNVAAPDRDDSIQWYWMFNEEGTADDIKEGLATIQLTSMVHHHGTAATADGDGHFFHDITAAFNFGTEVLERFSNTAPKIKFRTTLDHAGLELGDLISIDNTWFLSMELSLDGTDSNTKWEIISKEINPMGDSVGVEYQAVYMTKTSPPSTSISVATLPDIWGTPISQQFFTARDKEATSTGAVIEGLQITDAAGANLNYTVTAGKASASSPTALRLSYDQAMTAPASKDTYVGINSRSGLLCTTSVANGAAEPKLKPLEIRLGKVVTGGSAVSSVADMRQYGAITAKQFNRELLSPGFNGIWNGDFEIWASSGGMPLAWGETGDGKIGTDTFREETVVQRGRYALMMKNTSNSVLWFTDYFPVDRNTPQRITLWARQTGNVTMRADIFWYTATKAAASTSSTLITNAVCGGHNTWESRTAVATPGSDVVYGRIKLTRPTSPGYDCYWDDITVLPEPASFLAKRETSNFTSASTGDPVVFNAEVHDYGGVYNTTTGQFTAPSAGAYTFSTNVSFDGTASARLVSVALVGSTAGTLASSYIGSAANGTDEWNDVVVSLSVASASLINNEKVEVRLYWDAAAPVIRHTYSFFSGRKLT